ACSQETSRSRPSLSSSDAARRVSCPAEFRPIPPSCRRRKRRRSPSTESPEKPEGMVRASATCQGYPKQRRRAAFEKAVFARFKLCESNDGPSKTMHVHLIDGTYELFRHFFAVPSSLDAGGQEIGA